MKQTLKDISSGLNPLGPSRRVKAAIRKAVRRIDESPSEDEARLTRTFSSRLGLQEGCAVFSPSFHELLGRVLGALCPKKIWLAGPVDDFIAQCCRSTVAGCEDAPKDLKKCFRSNLAEIAGLPLERGHVVVISDPNTVTGCVMGQDDINAVLDVVSGKGALLLIDQSLAGFTRIETVPAGRVSDGTALVVGTTALYYGLPGLELAFVLGSEVVASRFRETGVCGPNLLALAAAREALRDAAYVRASEEYFRRERAMFGKRLHGSWTVHPSGAASFLLERQSGAGDAEESLRRSGFSAKRWRPADQDGSEFYRITVMRHEDNLKILKALGGVAGKSAGNG